MKLSNLACGLAVAAMLTASAAAADLAKIQRKIAKEPSYQSKAVKYCLLAFGPKAEKRVWIVLDGDDLYVDRNGNGDLTEKGEKTPRPKPLFGDYYEYEVGKLPAFGNRCTLQIDLDGDDFSLYFRQKGRYQQLAAPKLAATAADAPIVHLGGPLTLGLNSTELDCSEEVPEFYAVVGTPGLGEGAFASITTAKIPENVHPIAEFEFPNKNARGKPLKLKLELSGRC